MKAVKGTRDILPPASAVWNRVEAVAREVFRTFNYHEIRTPIFEETALFARGVWAEVGVRQAIFFWMRAGWGLVGPLALFPMVWGTVKIRSTMAATGILYVDVVAVVIGEVLGGWLAAVAHVPV